MLNFSSEKCDGFFRGVIRQGRVSRYTRKRFVDREEAELYTLDLMMRFRGIYPQVELELYA